MVSKFWMVYVDGTKGTHKMHMSKDLALEEAYRLHTLKNRPVFVLELIKAIE